jgi:hypothetical protein
MVWGMNSWKREVKRLRSAYSVSVTRSRASPVAANAGLEPFKEGSTLARVAECFSARGILKGARRSGSRQPGQFGVDLITSHRAESGTEPP